MKFYVHYLARTDTEDDVKEAFAPFGEISGGGLLRVPPNDEPIGVGYVEMTREHDLSAALDGIAQITTGGFPIRLDEPRCGVGRRTRADRRGASKTRESDRRTTSRRSLPRLAA